MPRRARETRRKTSGRRVGLDDLSLRTYDVRIVDGELRVAV